MINNDPDRFKYLVSTPTLTGDEEDELKDYLMAANAEADEYDWDEDGYDDGGI